MIGEIASGVGKATEKVVDVTTKTVEKAAETTVKAAEVTEKTAGKSIKNFDTRVSPKEVVKIPNQERKVNFDKRIEILDGKPIEINESRISRFIKDYVKQLKELSAFPDTISNKPFTFKDINLTPSDVVKERRLEFNKIKNNLIDKWEKTNNIQWPRYTDYVYDKHGNVIRKPGDRYDAHHIKPLFLGGLNEASNITPIHANNHYDHVGVHDTSAPLSKIKKEIGD